MTSMEEHPNYPCPTVQDALSEINFSPLAIAPWTTNEDKSFHNLMLERFSDFEPVSISSQLDNVTKIIPGLRYFDATHTIRLQISESNLVVSSVPVYPGWPKMREWLKFAIESLNQTDSTLKLTRIGIRYVNIIARLTNEDRMSNWLKSTDYVPSSVLDGMPGSFSVIQKSIDPENRLHVTVGEQNQPMNSLSSFVIDIDRMCNYKTDFEVKYILEECDKLHQDVWDVFNTAKSDKLEALLKGTLI